MAATGLRCEELVNPLGLDVPAPRLSWQAPAGQGAYQILAASAPERLAAGQADLWDSGRVASDACVLVPYGGPAPAARQRVYWAVRLWDEDGVAGPFSEPAWFEMGLLAPSDWVGQWIAPPDAYTLDAPPAPAPHLRLEFTVEQPVTAARLYLCGLGYHEAYLDGARVGDHVLDPAFTRYDARALYVTHDVTAQLAPGAHALGVILGCGFYNQHSPDAWQFTDAAWRHRPKLLAQLHLTFADGSERVIATDPSWKTGEGPIRRDGVRNGETYDARLEIPGWATVGFDDRAWALAEVTCGPGGRLSAQQLPIRVTQTLTPSEVWEARPGVFVVDLGQNIAGWAQLRVSGPAGTEIVLRYAEKLLDDRDIDPGNINIFVDAELFQTDRYTLKGEGEEVWEPRFCYHGFRYIQVTGFPGTPTVDHFRGRVAHTDFPSAGDFDCAHPQLAAVQQCTRWSYLGNFVGIPTDCPHREKNGWTGDAQLAAETGLFNFAGAPAYRKWLDDFADCQRPNGAVPCIVPTGSWGYLWGSGPAWDSAYINIPWYLYLYDGDLGVLARHYAGMRALLDYTGTLATDGIVTFGLGDWCPPGPDPNGHYCPGPLTSTAYYYADLRIVAATATLLGHADDAQRYADRALAVKDAFTRRFYNPESATFAYGGQTAQACPLYQGLVDPADAPRVLEKLIERVAACDYHPDFGILGAKNVLNVLTEYDRADVAYALATQTTHPSWIHWLAMGATTLWENWHGEASRNHIMFGDISAWMFKTLAGINPDPRHAGFKHVILRPHLPADLAWARATHETPYGLLRSAWEVEDDTLTWQVTVPGNTTATIYLPAEVEEPPVTVPAGDYTFTVNHPRRFTKPESNQPSAERR